jgi:hypothetical protein
MPETFSSPKRAIVFLFMDGTCDIQKPDIQADRQPRSSEWRMFLSTF